MRPNIWAFLMYRNLAFVRLNFSGNLRYREITPRTTGQSERFDMANKRRKWIVSKTKKLAALLMALLLTAGAGCSVPDGGDPGGDAPIQTQKQVEPTPTPTPEPPEETLDPEAAEAVKYNVYVQMNNKIVDVLDTLYSYYEVVEYADEFALIPDSEYTYKYDISGYNTDLLEDAQYVLEMDPPFEELDSLTEQILEPMRGLMETFTLISHNYDYAADQYAKPKEYHKAIQANAAVFQELAFQYMDAIQVMSIQRVEAEEQEMQDEGRLLAYGFSHSITVVKKITAECAAQDVSDENIETLDLAPIRPLYQELLDTIADYKAAAEDNNQLMKESMTADGAYHIGTQIDRMASALEWMIKQVESGRPIEDPGREYLGGLIHVSVVLSDCIDLYNSSIAS